MPIRCVDLIAKFTNLAHLHAYSQPIHHISKKRRIVGTSHEADAGIGVVVGEVGRAAVGGADFVGLVGGVSAVEVEAGRAVVGAELSCWICVSVDADTEALASGGVSVRVTSGLVAPSHAGVAAADVRVESWRALEDTFIEQRIAEVIPVAAIHAPKGDIVGIGAIGAEVFAGVGGVEFVHAVGAGVVGPDAHIGHVIRKGSDLRIEEGVIASEVGAVVGDVDDVALEGRSHANQGQVVAPTAARTHLHALPRA